MSLLRYFIVRKLIGVVVFCPTLPLTVHYGPAEGSSRGWCRFPNQVMWPSTTGATHTAHFCTCLCLCQWCHASLMLSGLSNRGRCLTGPGEVTGTDSLPDARGTKRGAGGLTVRTCSVGRWPGRLLPTGRDGAGSADGPAHLYLFSY